MAARLRLGIFDTLGVGEGSTRSVADYMASTSPVTIISTISTGLKIA